MNRSIASLAALAALVAGAVVCGRAPSAPTQPAAPAPTTTVAALPPSMQGCGVPKGTGTGHRCPYEWSKYTLQVEQAIAQLQRERPELFDFSQGHGGYGYSVRDIDRYHEGVLQNLRAMGFCAIFDGEELAVKRTNDFSEQYDIITSGGFVLWGPGSYMATCTPAWF